MSRDHFLPVFGFVFVFCNFLTNMFCFKIWDCMNPSRLMSDNLLFLPPGPVGLLSSAQQRWPPSGAPPAACWPQTHTAPAGSPAGRHGRCSTGRRLQGEAKSRLVTEFLLPVPVEPLLISELFTLCSLYVTHIVDNPLYYIVSNNIIQRCMIHIRHKQLHVLVQLIGC